MLSSVVWPTTSKVCKRVTEFLVCNSAKANIALKMLFFLPGVLWATGTQDQAKSKPVTSLLRLRWLMHSHFPVSVLNIMNTEKSECLERQGNMTAHKNENKDRNCFSHPGQSNCMTSHCRIMFSSIFGCDNLKHKRNGKNTYFLKENCNWLLVCISLGTN